MTTSNAGRYFQIFISRRFTQIFSLINADFKNICENLRINLHESLPAGLAPPEWLREGDAGRCEKPFYNYLV